MELTRKGTAWLLTIGRHAMILTDNDLAELRGLLGVGEPGDGTRPASAFDVLTYEGVMSLKVGQEISVPARNLNLRSVRSKVCQIRKRTGRNIMLKTNRTTGVLTVRREPGSWMSGTDPSFTYERLIAMQPGEAITASCKGGCWRLSKLILANARRWSGYAYRVDLDLEKGTRTITRVS